MIAFQTAPPLTFGEHPGKESFFFSGVIRMMVTTPGKGASNPARSSTSSFQYGV